MPGNVLFQFLQELRAALTNQQLRGGDLWLCDLVHERTQELRHHRTQDTQPLGKMLSQARG